MRPLRNNKLAVIGHDGAGHGLVVFDDRGSPAPLVQATLASAE